MDHDSLEDPLYSYSLSYAGIIDGTIGFGRSRTLGVTGNASKATIPFYVDILKATENGDYLEFLHNIPLDTAGKHIYVRDCYKGIANDILSSSKKNVAITGPPGIGTSHFMVYLLHHLLRMKKRVLFLKHAYGIYYDEAGVCWSFDRLGDILNQHKNTSVDLWCLIDDDRFTFETVLRNLSNTQIWAVLSSPRRAHLMNFKSFSPPNQFLQTPWSEAEMGRLLYFSS